MNINIKIFNKIKAKQSILSKVKSKGTALNCCQSPDLIMVKPIVRISGW